MHGFLTWRLFVVISLGLNFQNENLVHQFKKYLIIIILKLHLTINFLDTFTWLCKLDHFSICLDLSFEVV
jgi:hypothetical protein